LKLLGHEAKISRAFWCDLNRKIVTCSDDATVRLWDVETGKELLKSKEHRDGINNMSMYHDRSMFITASKDQTAKVSAVY
jgi:translation initiation factor 3 subunit I